MNSCLRKAVGLYINGDSSVDINEIVERHETRLEAITGLGAKVEVEDVERYGGECVKERIKSKYAVVTGANKGIGLEICKQLASKGITVVLTARDEERGLEAVEKLKEFDLSDRVVFHQLDVADPDSVASLVEFIEKQFGKLDILVNNAGIIGFKSDNGEALLAAGFGKSYPSNAFKNDYYGAKRMCESLLHLLQRSDSPRIVNVSSSMGKLKNVLNEWAKSVFSDVENLTEEEVDEVLSQYMKDFKEGSLEQKGWPAFLSAYILSKAAMNAYKRILAKKYHNFLINCVCPGFVKTDINYNAGI
ncbi:(+)-neomenthol dehydrogenase [Hibiscus syriacus]|uniref:(+)-neomenthol dehydrogenase n=1 Tax=Hibiscus syriacus TaxID=106335 RepID=A0A6A2WZ86_HIBSY|nr:(+)-neomenthol dehydrogenase [Hibiscus syriacus]